MHCRFVKGKYSYGIKKSQTAQGFTEDFFVKLSVFLVISYVPWIS